VAFLGVDRDNDGVNSTRDSGTRSIRSNSIMSLMIETGGSVVLVSVLFWLLLLAACVLLESGADGDFAHLMGGGM
jgi:hypothetical protein